jgi:hypothetical protein
MNGWTDRIFSFESEEAASLNEFSFCRGWLKRCYMIGMATIHDVKIYTRTSKSLLRTGQNILLLQNDEIEVWILITGCKEIKKVFY